jgi:uncharacterized protein (DUF488 family)
MEIWTIGHSNRSLEEFLALLQAHGIELLVDIRTVPRSGHNPHFSRDSLEKALPSAGIRYIHMPALGGLRHPRRDSINLGWRNASFRGYADYMQTPDFQAAISELIDLGRTCRTAIMCAEAVPWRCHRSLVADALVVREIPVSHILGRSKASPHKLTPFALVNGAKVTYPSTPLLAEADSNSGI